MKKILLTAITLGIFSLHVKAQYGFDWVVGIGSSGEDIGKSITMDASGNVYVTGTFEGTIEFDPEGGTPITPAGLKDIFVLKYEASGNFLWAKTIGGTSDDEPTSISTDALGNVYLTGSFQGTVDFDPAGGMSLSSEGSTDIFVLKLDATTGNFVWAKAVGGTGSDIGESITTDALGNVYVTGSFKGTVDFDPAGGMSLSSEGSTDIFVLKLDDFGAFVWAKAIGSATNDFGTSITLDASGNVYVTGGFRGTVDFNPGGDPMELISVGSDDIFVLKLDANMGNFVWAKTIGGTDSDIGYSITTDASENVYVTGSFRETVDFDPGVDPTELMELTSVMNSADIFVLKLDAIGDYVWAKAIGGTDFDSGESITLDASGNVCVTGSFRNTVDFDPGGGDENLISAESADIFVLKLNAMGNFLGAKAFGGTDFDVGSSIITDTSENVYITGFFSGDRRF